MPRINLPTRSRGGTAKASEEETATKEAATKEAATKEKPEAEQGTKVIEAKPATEDATKEAAKPATGAKPKAPEPNLQERMEGLQGWMAEIERRQGRLTYFGLAGVLIAVAAAGAALYFGITAKNDSATKGDVEALTKKVDALQTAATKSSKDAQNAINASVTQLQGSIATLQKQQSQNSANLSTLQSQVAAGALSKGAAGTATTPGATTPTTTTTPKKP
jgi:hypothetical protein